MFHIIHVEETDEPTTLRILLASQRLLETRHECRFDLDVLPTALDLSRRYLRDAAMPGKAAGFLSSLAVKFQTKEIHRSNVLEDFHATSGLDVSMLDTRARLRRKEIIEALSKDIIGQPQALEAMADVVTIAKARLNDPARPLGSLLFLGPTGVGKTQSAKALAKYLFGDASRLVRFDMNEFVTAESAARLAGVFDRPEGLLTSEVRRQPFSVILLDEIEKAHRDVFDLLLQVLGEGRLTDGLGRTADFTNTVIILTSNLGTRQAAERVGFDQSSAGEAAMYVKAVEDFFRPEFFNRLDRIVPFNRLERGELARIAEMTIHDVLAREGLVRRRCALQIAPEAMDWVIERGHHPLLGARAMKRAVEQELVQPLARQLATIAPSTPTVLQVSRPGEKIVVEAISLQQAVCTPEAIRPDHIDDPAAILERARRALDRLEEQYRQHRPHMAFSVGAISPQQYHYLACEELLKAARQEHRRLRSALETQRRAGRGPSLTPKTTRSHLRHGARGLNWSYDDQAPGELFAAQDIHEYLTEMAEQAAVLDETELERDLRELIEHTALLEFLAPDEDGWPHERVLLLVRSLDERSAPQRDALAKGLLQRFSFRPIRQQATRDGDQDAAFGLDVRPAFGLQRSEEAADSAAVSAALPRAAMSCPSSPGNLAGLVVEGCHAARLARMEEGTHLFTDAEGRLAPVQVIAWPIQDGEDPAEALSRCLAAREASRDHDAAADPFRFLPILRIYGHGNGAVLDLRTGGAATAAAADLTAMLLAALPLPCEFLDQPSHSHHTGG
jgi:hypothetical protein